MTKHLRIARVTFALAVAIFVGMEDEVLPADANYDEAKVPAYTLPDPLVMESGAKVTAPAQWPERRAELLRLFRDHVYGESPGRPEKMEFETIAERAAGEGIPGTRREIAIKLTHNDRTHTIPVVMYVPTIGPGPYPIFVGMHLFDTKAETPILGQSLKSHFEGDKKAKREPDEIERAMLDKLPGEKMLAVLLASGYAVATLDAETTAPDDAKRWTEGVVKLFLKEGETQPGPKEWGAIGVWAWSLSRALDYFQTDPQIDAKRVIAVGHSRMGKTALWAGAQDERFAIVISNNSGCGGAALSKRVFGETVKHINDRFPHWFCDEFNKYNDNESALPVDQHELIALPAPRPVYVASAEEDQWADPLGEWLAVRAAEPVFEIFGETTTGSPSNELPSLDQPLLGRIGYHIRIGKHALSDFDWICYLDLAHSIFYQRYFTQLQFTGKQIAYNQLRLLTEATFFLSSPRSAYRRGNALHIAGWGVDRVYVDNLPDRYSESIKIFRYVGSTANGAYQIVRANFYENTVYLLVDADSGLDASLDSVPSFSPDGKRFLTFSLGLDSGERPNRLMVWRVEKPIPVLEWKLEPSNWGPQNATWAANDAIAFDQTTFDPDNKPIAVPQKVNFFNGEWILQGSDSK